MKKNVGITDKWVRIVIAAVILALYGFGVIHDTVAMVLLVVGLILLITSLIGYCPLYSILGKSTCKKEE